MTLIRTERRVVGGHSPARPWARPRQSPATKHHLRFRQLQAWNRRYERGTALAATSEYLRLYALEGFLLRLAHSSHRNSLVLKGGMLLAAYELRRPTADVDLAALQTSNEVDEVRQLITEVAATAEKIVTALERGPASTRWRDFGDIYLVTGRYAFQAGEVRQALRSVADHRRVELVGLDDALDGYAEIGQPGRAAWRNKLELTETLPLDFGEALDSLRAFANPILTSSASDTANWDPVQRGWRPVVTGVTTKAAAAVTAASAAQSSALVR